MGSLPNLHELSKDKLNSPILVGHPPVKLPPQAPLMQTNRRSRSSGHHALHALWDNDAMLEHMTTYSPISYRTRASALSCRRKESMTSSAGTSSVRRLIAAVRTTPSGNRPPKKIVIRHCATVLLSHLTISAATLPMLPLQAGLGAFNFDLGPVLLAALYGTASISSCFSACIVDKLGSQFIISIHHFFTIIFISSHFYPNWWILLPTYILLGTTLSPSFLAKITNINICATNLSILCTDLEDSDENRKECFLRRLHRGLKLTEDLGLAIGCLIAAIIFRIIQPPVFNNLLESDVEKICGAEYCPQQIHFYNETIPSLPTGTAKFLLSIYLGLSVLAFGISCAFLDSRMKDSNTTDHLTSKNHFKQIKMSFQDPRLQLAAPLTLFVGLEQGFLFGDFTEAFIVCALGSTGTVILSFLSFALLQGIAGVTLSMLLRHIRRYFVVAVGFAFHACLLLALIAWKPTGDDPALFNVISAAWGVCNAIWEILIFTLLLGLYPYSWQHPICTSIFWKSLGLFLALGLHGLVCTRIRMFGLASMLFLSLIPYTWLEIRCTF